MRAILLLARALSHEDEVECEDCGVSRKKSFVADVIDAPSDEKDEYLWRVPSHGRMVCVRKRCCAERKVAPRIPVGATVTLTTGFAACSDAKDGPLGVGDTGVLIKDDADKKPYRVRAETGANAGKFFKTP